MKTISLFSGWRPQCYRILMVTLVTAGPSFAGSASSTPKALTESVNLIDPSSFFVRMTSECNSDENHPDTRGRSSAHRTLAAGPPSLADSRKTKRCLSDSEFVLFRNQEHDGSAKCPALEFFGSFWGDAKKNITRVDTISRDCFASSGSALVSSFVRMTLQQHQITGTVSDQYGPLPGVTITIKDGTAVTISDQQGRYAIAASPTDTLIFTYLGFKTQEHPINGLTTINAVMTEDATALQEVTINAGYYTVKDKERTGSIATIKAADIEKQPVTNVLATMQGRMAGVNVTQETGVPGGGFNINIRGVNSLRADGNAPLYIIDGVPYSSAGISHIQTSTNIPGEASPLNSINPADIESLEILKDADATAIYGSRGANGVVLITTKKGKSGETVYSFTNSYALGNVTRMADLMNTEQYLRMRRQAYENDGITTYPANAYDVNGRWDQERYTDWQEELIGGTAEIRTLQGSVSGGSAQTRFLFGANYRTETTVFPGSSLYKKGGAHVSINHSSPDQKFTLGFSGSYSAQSNNMPWIDFVDISRTLAPNAPALYDEDGNLNWEEGTWANPLRNLAAQNRSKTFDLIASTLLYYELAKGLILKSSFGFTDLRNDDSRTSPSTIYNPSLNWGSNRSSIIANEVARQSWIIEPQVNYEIPLGNSRIELLAGATFQDQKSMQFVQRGSDFPSNGLIYDLSAAASHTIILDEHINYRYQAYFGRVNYSFKDRYFINVTGRRDGSSRFGPDRQFANFGAVGAAWLFYKERLVASSLSFLSFGKLRGSYGTTGNDQIGDYGYLNTYGTSGFSYLGTVGMEPIRLHNPDFGWEKNAKMEAALELGFFDDRIFVTTAWYRNRSSNQLVGIPLPGTTGFTSIQANLNAEVQNSGFELTLRTVNVEKANFKWVTSFNLTAAQSKLLSFPGLESSTYRNDYVVGEPITIRKLFNYTGVNPETGVFEFEDVNGDGVISYDDDRETVRDFSPEFYGGFQNQISYKGIQLDFLFQFVKQQNFNGAYTQGYAGLFRNQPASFIDNWTQPGDQASYQVYTTGLNDDAMTASDYFAESTGAVTDASYIRLKSVALSYDLPARWLKGLKCRLSVAGQNLFTITKYDGPDPEFRDAGALPPLRVISTSVQLTF